MATRRLLRLRPSQAIPALVGVAVLLLCTGCGGPGGPVTGPEGASAAQDIGDPTQAQGKRFVFYPFGRAQDRTPVALSRPARRSKSATKAFEPGVEDQMEVRLNGYIVGMQTQAKKAVLVVKEESVPPPGVTVDMTLYSGTRLEDISVVFGPSGYQFDGPARLRILLWGELTEEEVSSLQAYHISGDTVEPIDSNLVLTDAGNWRIIIKVPGFSEYSIGGDDEAEDDECWDGIDPP